MLLPISIVKCGGSLLNLPNLPDKLLSFLHSRQQTAANTCGRTAVVMGGGATAEQVRTWDRRFGLHPADAHRLAIHAMSFNAKCLTQQNSRLQMVASTEQIQRLPADHCGILDASAALSRLAASATTPPESWDVTSDSLAAWFATQLQAQELLLLKSTDAPTACLNSANPAQALSDAGLIDPAFPQFVSGLRRLLWCNFRHPETPHVQKIRIHRFDDARRAAEENPSIVT